jgi:hypothetical protein
VAANRAALAPAGNVRIHFTLNNSLAFARVHDP